MAFRSKYGAQIIMTPTYIMPPKPTCKVVKREGERGARIDPKGCKVRTTKDAQGNKRQYNKRGEEKITAGSNDSGGERSCPRSIFPTVASCHFSNSAGT